MIRWLRSVRATQGINQGELANYIGKTRSTVAMYESGSPVPPETVALIRSSFPQSPPPPKSDDILVSGTAQSDDLYSFIKYAGVVPCSSSWGDPLSSDEVRSIEPKFGGKNRFLCRVEGDSCYPALQQGDMTVWETDPAPAFGLIVLAQLEDDSSCTVKQLLRGETPGQPILAPVNPDYARPSNSQPWKVVARLIGIIDPEEVMSLFRPSGFKPEQLEFRKFVK